MKTRFLTPKLEGDRFVEHSIPLETLKDWASFEDLIVEVARWLYLKDNPDRQRVPRGFSERFVLHLSGVEDGSAIPVIDRLFTDGNLPIGDWFERARDTVLTAIAIAAAGGSLVGQFPPDLLGYFDQFGRSLRDGERIEFTTPANPAPVVYDRAVRKRLVLSGAKEYRAAAELRGSISEVDAEKGTFTLRLVTGAHLPGSFAIELRKTVVAALAEFETSKVLVKGIVLYDQVDRPRKIDETSHIEVLDANDVPARLEEIGLLKKGWLDGEGVVPTPDGLRWLSTAWQSFYPAELPLPYVYPTPEGKVRLEWSIDSWEGSADLNVDDRRALLIAVDVLSGDEIEREIGLGTGKGWEDLAKFLRDRA